MQMKQFWGSSPSQLKFTFSKLRVAAHVADEALAPLVGAVERVVVELDDGAHGDAHAVVDGQVAVQPQRRVALRAVRRVHVAAHALRHRVVARVAAAVCEVFEKTVRARRQARAVLQK